MRAPLATITDPSGEFEVEGRRADGDRPRSFVQAVLGPLSPLGIGIHEGRFFDSRDSESSAGTAIVSQALAERYWPGRSPIGARLRMPGLGEAGNWRVVVGVVGNVLHGNPLSRDRSPIAAYVPLRQSELAGAAVVVRHRGSVAAGRGALLQTLGDLDPLLVPGSVTSFDEMLSKTTLIARSVAVEDGDSHGSSRSRWPCRWARRSACRPRSRHSSWPRPGSRPDGSSPSRRGTRCGENEVIRRVSRDRDGARNSA